MHQSAPVPIITEGAEGPTIVTDFDPSEDVLAFNLDGSSELRAQTENHDAGLARGDVSTVEVGVFTVTRIGDTRISVAGEELTFLTDTTGISIDDLRCDFSVPSSAPDEVNDEEVQGRSRRLRNMQFTSVIRSRFHLTGAGFWAAQLGRFVNVGVVIAFVVVKAITARSADEETQVNGLDLNVYGTTILIR